MAICPCCGESTPALAEPDQLCPACSRAMDTGTDPSGVHLRPVPQEIQRPMGVALLALAYFAFGMIFLIAAVLGLLDIKSFRGFEPRSAAFISLLAGSATVFLSVAFWNLREWVRVLALAFSVLSLLGGNPTSDWWVRAFHLTVIFYLLSPGVRATFRMASEQPTPHIVSSWLERRNRLPREASS